MLENHLAHAVAAGKSIAFCSSAADVATPARRHTPSAGRRRARALFSGGVSDRFGRKSIIILADVFFTVGSITAALAPTIWCLELGRFILGLGVGCHTQIIVYISEIAPVEVRGRLVAFDVLVTTFA